MWARGGRRGQGGQHSSWGCGPGQAACSQHGRVRTEPLVSDRRPRRGGQVGPLGSSVKEPRLRRQPCSSRGCGGCCFCRRSGSACPQRLRAGSKPESSNPREAGTVLVLERKAACQGTPPLGVERAGGPLPWAHGGHLTPGSKVGRGTSLAPWAELGRHARQAPGGPFHFATCHGSTSHRTLMSDPSPLGRLVLITACADTGGSRGERPPAPRTLGISLPSSQ